MYCKKKFIKR